MKTNFGKKTIIGIIISGLIVIGSFIAGLFASKKEEKKYSEELEKLKEEEARLENLINDMEETNEEIQSIVESIQDGNIDDLDIKIKFMNNNTNEIIEIPGKDFELFNKYFSDENYCLYMG